jgi:hypothetical protein
MESRFAAPWRATYLLSRKGRRDFLRPWKRTDFSPLNFPPVLRTSWLSNEINGFDVRSIPRLISGCYRWRTVTAFIIFVIIMFAMQTCCKMQKNDIWHFHRKLNNCDKVINNKLKIHRTRRCISIWQLSFIRYLTSRKRVSGFILCMFGMELANQIMGSAWEYVGKRWVTWHWIKQIFDLIKFVIRVTARMDDGNLRNRGKPRGPSFRRSQFYLRLRNYET